MFSKYLGIAAVVGALIFGGISGYKLGAAKSDKVILQLQRDHIAAMEEQKERSALVVKDLYEKRIQVTKLQEQLNEEARNDPDAGRVSLPSRSLQRLDQIR